jgi:hypothetical protein
VRQNETSLLTKTATDARMIIPVPVRSHSVQVRVFTQRFAPAPSNFQVFPVVPGCDVALQSEQRPFAPPSSQQSICTVVLSGVHSLRVCPSIDFRLRHSVTVRT